VKFEGRLDDLLHSFAVKQEPLPCEKELVKKQAPQVAETLKEKYGDTWSHSMQAMNVRCSGSGGLSKVFRKIAS
jgi:hypothetical protein